MSTEREVAPGWKLTTWEDWPSDHTDEPSPSLEGATGDGAEFDKDGDLIVFTESKWTGLRRVTIPGAALSALLQAQAQRGMRRADRDSASQPPSGDGQ